ncbi:unnamed protein product [Meloidogyne enterolobii]|uniref:Uncharacterized protein n=1 Tax=Meloidogyne enterolobii TaxID=390850 RepID=A0ACB1A1V0_MELEN
MYFITKGSQKTGRKEPKINNLEDYKNFIEPFITKIIESKVYLDWNKRKHNYEERSRKLGGTKYDLVYFKDVYEKLVSLFIVE